MCVTSCSICHSDKIQSFRNSTHAMGEVGCKVGQVEILAACPEGWILTVDMYRVTK